MKIFLFLRKGGSEAKESCEVRDRSVLWEGAAVKIRPLSDWGGRWGGRAEAEGYDPLNASIVAANNIETH